MKLREKLKRFWTLDVHNHEGFTLVELIIVIAILAILSTGAIAGYSVYIKQANMTADKTMVAGIINIVTLANYDQAIPGVGSVVLSNGNVVFAGDDATKAWLNSVLTDAYGSNYSGLLKLKYNGWGNGAAAAQTMYDALVGDFADAMEGIYGNADSLSFTEEIPQLMEEIRGVAEDFADGDDQKSITMLNAAAGVTSGWDLDVIQELWTKPISYAKNAQNKWEYSGYTPGLFGDTAEETIEVTMAGLLRAKNTCLALYAAQNGFPQYYGLLSSFSISDTSIRPYDLTRAAVADSPEHMRLIALLGEDATEETLNALGALLLNYESAEGGQIAKNDATAYAAMMGIVDNMAANENVQADTIDEYMNTVTGAATMFQKLVDGSLTMDELAASLSGATSANNVTITIVPNGSDVVIICSPTAAKD